MRKSTQKTSSTKFSDWRKKCNLSVRKAAEALQISRSYAYDLENGVVRSTGRPVNPSKQIMMLMDLLYEARKKGAQSPEAKKWTP